MPKEYNLPIENDPELLTEYGRAFAFINFVEFLLGEMILMRQKLYLGDKKERDKIKDKTLGQQIKLAKGIIDSNILDEISKLNEKRKIMAHGVTVGGVGDFLIVHNKGNHPLNKKSIGEVITLARSCLGIMHEALLKGTNYEKFYPRR